MAVINRVRAALTGFPGGPGVSTFYCLNPNTFLPLLRDMYFNNSVTMPFGVTVTIENTGDVIDSTTGVLTNTWTAAPVVFVQGQGGAGYSAPSGACVTWTTGTILDGTRLRGRTFLVPLTGDSYQSDGSLDPVTLTRLRDNAASLVNAAAANFVVYHRPIAAGKLHGPRAGGHSVVTGSLVRDKVAVLRSRRD